MSWLSPIIEHPIARHRGLRQFIKFGLVGVINTATSTFVYYLGTRGAKLDPLLANVAAFLVAVSVSFFLNKHWTFRDRQGRYRDQYPRFLMVSGIGLGLSEAIIAILHRGFAVHDLIAFGAATILVMVWNFLANRRWTFTSS